MNTSKQRKWTDRNILLGIAVAVTVMSFFYIQRKTAFVVYDDILFYVNTREGDMWNKGKELALENRFYYLYAYLLYAIPYVIDSLIYTKVVSCLSILFSTTCLFWLIKKLFGNKWGVLTIILFYAFAQINGEHNPMISYIFYHQVTIGAMLLAIERFIAYYKERKRTGVLVLSAILYAIPIFMYESLLFYSLFFFAMSIYYQFQKHEAWFVTLKSSLWDLRYHIILSVLYLCIFLVWGKTHPVTYDGAQWNFTGIGDFIHTVVVLSVGLFPLNSFFHILRQVDFTKCIDPFLWLKAMISSYAIIYLLRTINFRVKFHTLIIGIGSMVFAMLLPSIPYGLTSKFTAMVVDGGTYGYVSTYFSYFFIIILWSLLLLFIYQRIRFKKVFLLFLFVIIMTGSICTDVGNLHCADGAQYRMDKGDAFKALIMSPKFQEIPDGTEILAPDYASGEALTELVERYVKAVANKEIKILSESSGRELYEIKYNVAAKSVLFAPKVEAAKQLSQVIVCSADQESKSVIVGANVNNCFSVKENDIGVGIFRGDAVIPLNYVNSISVLECSDGIDFGGIQIVNQKLKNNSLVKASFSEGFYEEESWGRWSREKSKIEIVNDTDQAYLARLNLAVKTGCPVTSNFTVITPDEELYRFILDGRICNLQIETIVRPGVQTLKLISDAPQLDSGADPRALYFSVTDMCLNIVGSGDGLYRGK